jgi:hypothetical protein
LKQNSKKQPPALKGNKQKNSPQSIAGAGIGGFNLSKNSQNIFYIFHQEFMAV